MSHSPISPSELAQASSRNSPYRLQLKRLNTLIDHGGSLSGNERNCAFLSMGPSAGQVRFASVSAVTGLDAADDSRCYGVTDWDHDGDVDLWVMNRTAPRVRVMLNEQSTKHHFLSLRLVGRTCNSDAIGARVEVFCSGTAGSPVRMKSLRAGEGFLSQSTKWLHFGLGQASAIDHVVVHWPDGRRERFTKFELDRQYRMVQGSGVPHPRPPSQHGFALVPPTTSPDVATSEAAEVLLTSRVPLPRLPLKTIRGQATQLDQALKFPVLLNLWASWCAPCQQELRDLARQHQELQRQGVSVAALSVDGLGEEPFDQDAMSRYLEELKLPFFVGFAAEETRVRLQFVDDLLFAQKRDLAVPSSFLIDREGRLAAIYRGPLKTTTLAQHVRQLALTGKSLYEAALPFPGVWHRPRGFSAFMELPIQLYQRQQLDDAARYLFQHREMLVSQKQFVPLATQVASRLAPSLRAESISLYRLCLSQDPDNLAALNNLAWNLIQQPDQPSAVTDEALQLADRAARLTQHQNLIVLDTLAQAQHAAGEHEASLQTCQRALTIAQREGDKQRISQIQKMIQKVRKSQAAARP